MVKEREALAERLFLGLRLLEGVDGESFRREFGVTLEGAYPAELPGLLGDRPARVAGGAPETYPQRNNTGKPGIYQICLNRPEIVSRHRWFFRKSLDKPRKRN